MSVEPTPSGRPPLPPGDLERRRKEWKRYIDLLDLPRSEIAAITGLSETTVAAYGYRRTDAPSQRALDALWTEIEHRREDVIRRKRSEVNRLAYDIARAKTDIEFLERMADAA